MNRRCIYFVEGECEKQLIAALKITPERLIPGKVKVYNVIQKLIPKSQLLSIQPKTTVALVFDTDVSDRRYLDKNIELIKNHCVNVSIVNLMQVMDFEDEMVRSTDVNEAIELTKSKSTSNFKTDFCRINSEQCRNLLDRHKFDVRKLWVTKPPEAFDDLQQEGNEVILKQ